MKCTKLDCDKETGADWKTLCSFHYKNRSIEEVREARQKKLDKKVARMKSKAEKLDSLGESKQAEYKSYHGDISFFTQPASPSSRFGRQRKRIYDRFDSGIKMQIEADDLREKAKYLEREGAVVKGDAERKRQAKRDELDKVISVGSKVYDYLFKEGEVIRVNKKTYTIRFASGGTYAREKVYVKPIEEAA